MAVTNVYCSGDTCVGYGGEQDLNAFTNYGNLQKIQVDPLYSSALLQFEIPSNIKYKKINRVFFNSKVNAHIKPGWDLFIVTLRQRISAFIVGSNISNTITYANQTSHGYVGSSISANRDNIHITTSGEWISTEVTSLFENGIVGNWFSLLVKENQGGHYHGYTIDSAETSNPSYLMIEYDDIGALEPTITSPLETYEQQDKEVNFTWIYNSATAATQQYAEIGWRKKGTSTYNDTITFNQGSFTFISNVFPQGIIEWRIRTTDEAGQTSGYSYASFSVIGRPSTPIITTIDNKALTTINWNSVEQSVFEISVLKNGVEILRDKISTQVPKYSPKIFLDNDTYEVKIRIMNQFDIWSEWTGKVFFINATKPAKPSLIVSSDSISIRIKATYITENAYLYRQEIGKSPIPLTKLTSSEYTDSTVKNDTKYNYFIRAYTDGYSDSDVKSGRVNFKGFILSNGIDSIDVTQSEEPFMSFKEQISQSRKLTHYSGREFPISEKGEHKTHSITRKFYVKENDYSKLIDMYYSDSIILYRDNKKRKMYCDLSNIQADNTMLDRGYIVELTFTELDYDEGVDIN